MFQTPSLVACTAAWLLSLTGHMSPLSDVETAASAAVAASSFRPACPAWPYGSSAPAVAAGIQHSAFDDHGGICLASRTNVAGEARPVDTPKRSAHGCFWPAGLALDALPPQAEDDGSGTSVFATTAAPPVPANMAGRSARNRPSDGSLWLLYAGLGLSLVGGFMLLAA